MTPYGMSNAALDSAVTSLCLLALAAFIALTGFRNAAARRLWLAVRRSWRVGRDVLIIIVLQGVVAIALGVSMGLSRDSQFPVWVAAFAALAYIIGFAISGCLAPPGRWRHLGFVAAGVWLLNMVVIAFFFSYVAKTMSGGVEIMTRPGGAIFRVTMLGIGSAMWFCVAMGLGGALSYIFKKDK